MRNSSVINIMNEYLVYKNQSLGKGATGEVYLGTSLLTQARALRIRLK
jgi:hypothetical protein